MTAEVTTAECSGNTIPSHTFRGRAFLLTLNQVDKYDLLMSFIKKLKSCDYYISCKEIAPTTGHEHIHIYIHFTSSYKLNKKILSVGAHVDICKGSPQQNIAYVRKDGNIIEEWGDEPKQGHRTVADLKQINNPDVLNWNEYSTWRKIKDETNNDIDIDDWHKDVVVYYIQGPSGIGKTERAKQIVREHKEKYGTKINQVKYENNFWIGVGTDAKIAIYDDFRDSHMKASEFINFIDYNKHTMNIKGAQKINEYQLIIITSVQPLCSIYNSCQGEPRRQWERRIQLIKLARDDDNDFGGERLS